MYSNLDLEQLDSHWEYAELLPFYHHTKDIWSVRILHLNMFMGVGSVSEEALKIKDSWPGGKPHKILFHTGASVSRSKEACSFDWTWRDERWLPSPHQ